MVTSRGVRASNTAFGRWISFTGRTQRAPFWTWTGTVFVLLGISLALQLIPSSGDGMMWARVAGVLSLLIVLAVFVPNVAFLVRRLHDANISGWVVLIGVIPILGGLILLTLAMLPSNPRGRRFDRGGVAAARTSSPRRKAAAAAGSRARSATRATAPATSVTMKSTPVKSTTTKSTTTPKSGSAARTGAAAPAAPRLTRSTSSRETRR